MARRLPWKKHSESNTSPSSARPSPSSSNPTKTKSEYELPRQGTPSRAGPLRTPRGALRGHQQRVLDSDPIRSPSTSPPPERPKEKFMIPGAEADDRYRMVEDELLHMAQQFTAHLHRAEYDRLKALAKSQNAETIREIERPVVPGGTPTNLTRRRAEAARRDGKQRRALRESGGGGGEEEDGGGLGGAKGLRGLMNVPVPGGRAIMPAVHGSLGTRASAGFDSNTGPSSRRRARGSPSRAAVQATPGPSSSSHRRENSHYETPSRRAHQVARPPTRTPPPQATTPRTPRLSSSSVKRVAIKDPPSETRSERALGKRRASTVAVDDDGDDDEDDDFGLRRRRLDRQKSREQFRKADTPDGKRLKRTPQGVGGSLDTIPSFF